MNFFPATYARAGKADAVLADGQKMRLPDGLPLTDGDKITIGLRPEHIQVGGKEGLKAEVEVVEPLGLSTQFYARLRDQQICVFAMGRPMVKPGEAIRLSAEPSALHVFDPESGMRIGG
jgi:multiple sugar transport system ATP-binding protein